MEKPKRGNEQLAQQKSMTPRRGDLLVSKSSGSLLALARRCSLGELLIWPCSSPPLGLLSASLQMASPSALIQRGMQLFRELNLAASLEVFDSLYAAHQQLQPQLWQRGLALYYANRFAEGAAQFRLDAAAYNTADAEEAIWACLCESRLEGGLPAARARMLAVGQDPRPVLRIALRVFRGEAGAEELAQAGAASAHDSFYALLYEGLLLEAQGNAPASARAISSALASPYAASSSDFMVSVARMHEKQRRGAEGTSAGPD